MPKPEPTTIEPKEVPEVRAFLKAQKALEELKSAHPAAFKKLLELSKPYNAELEAAEAAVRERRASCGPFRLLSFSAHYDPEALMEAVGRAKFEQMGGVVETKEVYSIDRLVFEALVAQKKIPDAVAEAAVDYRPSFKKLARIALP